MTDCAAEVEPDTDFNLDNMIKEHVQRVLILFGGNQTVAAQKLGRSRFWLARRLRAWGLRRERLSDRLRREQREKQPAEPEFKSEADAITEESPKYHDISTNDIGY